MSREFGSCGATWVGQDVGKPGRGQAINYRGAIYYQSASPEWSRLNNVAAIFEYEVDEQGNTDAKILGWK